jgi:hypothetical protein
MAKKKTKRRRSVRGMLVVRGQKVGSVTFKNPESARAWARSVGVPVQQKKKAKRKKAKSKKQKAKAKRRR